MLGRRLQARPVVVELVGVGSGDDGGQSERLRLGGGERVQLGLAEVAAVHRVAGVARIFQLRGCLLDVPRPELPRDGARSFELIRRDGGRQRGESDGPLPQRIHRQRQQQRRVHAAGVRHERAAQRTQSRDHLIPLVAQRRSHRRYIAGKRGEVHATRHTGAFFVTRRALMVRRVGRGDRCGH